MKKSLNNDVLKYLIVKIFTALSGVLTIFFLTRTLSLGLFSNYAFVMATILLFGQLISGWINSSVIYFYPEYNLNNKIDVLKMNMIVIQLILYFLGVIGFFIVCYIGLESISQIFIGILMLFSQTFIGLLYSFLQAERRILIQIKASIIQSVIQLLGFLYCFLHFRENIEIVLFIYFISYMIPVLYIVYSDKIYIMLLKKANYNSVNLETARKILFYGLPVCLWFFLFQFFSIGDRILFKYFNVTNLVGNYASFRDLSLGLSAFITNPLLMASHPVIMSLSSSNADKSIIEKIIVKNIVLLITFFTPIFIAVLLLGDWFLSKIVEKKYMLENSLMFLVVLSVFFSAVSMFLHKGLEAKGKTMLMTKIALGVAIVSLILNIIFIPRYGVKASCIISVFSQFLYCFVVYNFSRKIFLLKISYFFVMKNILVIFFTYLITHYFLYQETFYTYKIVIFACFTLFILLSTPEIREILKFKK
ncbi:lipopolysaccharide biosynthesis protein [Flavobacterium sp.]|uniref:lipopolysaccharide biosynthesis protein n=1 Tax=Flavobacterium sp. TaxID=239 RepID=UPI00286DA716|nr:lipopolysaccharide biosynthesis protein [Flavobacterium sp.]